MTATVSTTSARDIAACRSVSACDNSGSDRVPTFGHPGVAYKDARSLYDCRTHLWQIVVRVESDAGIVGYSGRGKAAVEVVNGHMRELLVGRSLEDPADIAAAWDALYYASTPYGRKGIGVMALSGNG